MQTELHQKKNIIYYDCNNIEHSTNQINNYIYPYFFMLTKISKTSSFFLLKMINTEKN